jgi:hypothetical protein
VPGLTGTFNFAWGTGAIDPQTQAGEPDQREYNFKIDYRPPWLASTILRGLVPCLINALADQAASSS